MTIKSITNITLACCVTGAVLATLVACGEGKVAQCNKLSEAINKIDVTPPKDEDPNGMDVMAGKFEKSATDVAAVTVADAKLQEIQKKYVENLRAMAKSTKDMGEAIKKLKADPAAAASAEMPKMPDHGTESGKIVDEMNKYCQG